MQKKSLSDNSQKKRTRDRGFHLPSATLFSPVLKQLTRNPGGYGVQLTEISVEHYWRSEIPVIAQQFKI